MVKESYVAHGTNSNTALKSICTGFVVLASSKAYLVSSKGQSVTEKMPGDENKQTTSDFSPDLLSCALAVMC
jgi:hypothetical protein